MKGRPSCASSAEARLVYRLPEPDVHGRQELRLTPIELLERLARLVPPPRIHRHRPACSGEMRIISFITLPEFEFDQSLPREWDV